MYQEKHMFTRQQLIDFCLGFPESYEDYPFSELTGPKLWTVMRHRVNKKGFAHIFEREDKLFINLKCDPLEADFLRSVFDEVTPAYHMNKNHWNSVEIGGKLPIGELERMIAMSYDLIKPVILRVKTTTTV